MLNLGARVYWFVSSYSLLFVAFAVSSFIAQNSLACAACFVVAVAGFVGLPLLVSGTAHNTEGTVDTVEDYHIRGEDALGYVVAYLLPFLALVVDQPEARAVLILLLLALGYIYVVAQPVHINPTLWLVGFRVYDVRLERHGRLRVITRRPMRRGNVIGLVKIAKGTVLEKVA